MSRARKGYEFSSKLRKERLKGADYCCERCGKHTRNLEVHHLVGAWLASQNPCLSPSIIRVLENEMCLCSGCHKIMNEDQENWTAKDIAFVAWALFDIDPQLVEENQKAVYGDFKKGEKRVKKDLKKSHRKKRTKNDIYVYG